MEQTEPSPPCTILEQVQIADEQFGRSDTKHFYIVQGAKARLFMQSDKLHEKNGKIDMDLPKEYDIINLIVTVWGSRREKGYII